MIKIVGDVSQQTSVSMNSQNTRSFLSKFSYLAYIRQRVLLQKYRRRITPAGSGVLRLKENLEKN